MITEYTHHGKKVKVQEHLKGRHREHCLCFMCKHFNPDNHDENCMIANEVYENCVDFNIVTPVWECPEFEEKDG